MPRNIEVIEITEKTRLEAVELPKYSRHDLDEGTWYHRLTESGTSGFVWDGIWLGDRKNFDIEIRRETLLRIPPKETTYYLGKGDYVSGPDEWSHALEKAQKALAAMG